MKKVITSVLVLLLMSFTTADSTLTKSERAYAVEQMCNTRSRVIKAVKGLSEAQLNFKSDPESWSIAECIEHIALSEGNFMGMVKKSLEAPSDPSRRSEIKITDDAIYGMVTDRSNKVKTRAPFEPSGKYGSYKATLKAFKKKRKEVIKYVKKTEDDLRNHYMELPFGTVDTYQVLLFLSGHTERHVLQIEEIMAHKDFPVK